MLSVSSPRILFYFEPTEKQLDINIATTGRHPETFKQKCWIYEEEDPKDISHRLECEWKVMNTGEIYFFYLTWDFSL